MSGSINTPMLRHNHGTVTQARRQPQQLPQKSHPAQMSNFETQDPNKTIESCR
jgi:hypothetical protein